MPYNLLTDDEILVDLAARLDHLRRAKHLKDEELAGGFAFSIYCRPRATVQRFLLIESEDEMILDVLLPADDAFVQFIKEGLRQVDFAGVQIPVVASEVLYALKKSSSRDRDRADAAELEACLGGSIDRAAGAYPDHSPNASTVRRCGLPVLRRS